MTITEKMVKDLEILAEVEESNARTYGLFKGDDRFLDKCERASAIAGAYRRAVVILKEAEALEEV